MKDAEGPAVHPDEGQLLAWMDGELSPRQAADLEAHTRACEVCERRLSDFDVASTSLSHMLNVDGAVPRRAAAAVRRRWLRRRFIRPLPVAAVLVLLFTGGALAMVPGSPLRSWIEGLRHRPSTSAWTPSVPALVPQLSLVSPDSIDIVVQEPRDTLDLELVRSAGRRIRVETDRAHVHARLQLGTARLTIDPGTARVLRIRFPNTARVRVLLGGSVLASSGKGANGRLPSSRDSVTSMRVDPVADGREPR